MRTINFLKAGQHNPRERVFLATNARANARGRTVYHRNRYSTVWRIPIDVFRTSFHWEAASGIYHTELTYGDIAQYAIIIDHNEETGL